MMCRPLAGMQNGLKSFQMKTDKTCKADVDLAAKDLPASGMQVYFLMAEIG